MQGVSSHFQFCMVVLKSHSCSSLLRCILFFAALFVGSCFANSVFGTEVEVSSSQSLRVIPPSSQIAGQPAQVDTEAINIALQHIAELEAENNLLKQKLSVLNESQSEKAKLDSTLSSAVTFPVWTSILLGCVAVIVTTLGVGLAIFSYFGYREAMRRSAEIAKDTASEVARSEIIRKMENGDFKAVIEEAIDRVAFRSFRAGDDIDES